MFSYWKKLDQLNQINRLLVVLIGVLAILVFVLGISLACMPHRLRFFITPTLAQKGGELKAEVIPQTAIYSFVATLFPMLHSWQGEDPDEYSKILQSYKPYLSPRHLELAEQAYLFMKETGVIHKFQQASLYSGFEPQLVESIAPNLWTVRLKLRLTQRLSEKNSLVISDKIVGYQVRVIRVHLSHEMNPFELALDGYGEKEVLIKNLLDEEQYDS